MEIFVLTELAKAGTNRHFCKIEDKGQLENFNYVVMTFVRMSLADLKAGSPGKKFSYGTAISVGIQALEALEDLHGIGYLHSDVKSGNYTIGRAELNELRKVYVLDFGMARKFVRDDGTIKKPRAMANFRGTIKYAPTGRADKRLSPLEEHAEHCFGRKREEGCQNDGRDRYQKNVRRLSRTNERKKNVRRLEEEKPKKTSDLEKKKEEHEEEEEEGEDGKKVSDLEQKKKMSDLDAKKKVSALEEKKKTSDDKLKDQPSKKDISDLEVNKKVSDLEEKKKVTELEQKASALVSKKRQAEAKKTAVEDKKKQT